VNRILSSRAVRVELALLVLVIAVLYFAILWPVRDPHPKPQPSHGVLAIRDVKIYPSPDAPPLEHANVVVRDGLIEAVGPEVPIPPEAHVLSCQGCILTAGFWNAHVHFTEEKWSYAPWTSAAKLNNQLADMLTSRGFTTVVDASSDLRVTLSLRRRIESGDLAGPAIYTAGSGLYPPNGIPYYLKNSLPFLAQWLLPQPSTPEDAARLEERNIGRGADLLKLFTGSYVERGKVLPMPEPIARAAVEVAHKHGQIAYSHPSDFAGTKVARDSGVDVLAHAPDSPDGIDEAFLRSLVEHHMAMVPTLKMFSTTVSKKPAYLLPIYAEVRQFHQFGGQLMFGTDVGYMTDYSTDGEFDGLKLSALGMTDILRMLTTVPSERFGVIKERGTVEVGKRADLVLLEADPSVDVVNFSRVRFTVRNGRVIYQRSSGIVEQK